MLMFQQIAKQVKDAGKVIDRIKETIIPTMQETLGDEIDELPSSMNRLRDQVKDRPDSSCSLPQENRHTNIVIRNMVQRENENVERRVNGLMQDSLRLRDISVAKAVRKQSRSDSKPGLIIATMKSNEEKETVMKHKRHLKNSSRYEHVYIENDIPASQRAVNSNFRTLINALGRDKFQLKEPRISVREETSETGN